MGKFQAMHKYVAVFLALFACHDSLLTHGRKIKALNTYTTLKQLKTNVNVPTLLSNKKVDSPMLPKHSVASFEESGANTNAFRPTTPGSSPGVGHRKFAGEDKDVKAMVVVQSPDVRVYKKVDSPMMPKHSVETFGESGANTNAFKPTTPGSSPGVGHRKFDGEDKDMNAMVVVQSPDVKVYVTEGSKNDFSPTTPGHSPGVGHSHQNNNGKLN